MLLLNLVLAVAMVPGAPSAGQGQSSANSRSPHGSLSIPCQNCHTQSGWKPIRAVPEFDHNTTKYPLRGLHEGVACTQCHVKPVFSNVGKECADCHADIHKRQMGANCEQCHSVRGWHVSVQQINQHLNRFPLIGAHATVDCDSCHKSAAVGQFQGLSTQCISCHQRDFINTKSAGLDHVALNFPTGCEQCHSMDNWLGAKFDHSGPPANFPLTGAHASLDCNACHLGGKFAGTPATCVGCHLADFNKTNNPPHAQAGFPTTCQTCHSTSAWDPSTFSVSDHNTFTKFQLTGAHTTVACIQCHINNQFAGTPTDCASCHIKDFNGTTNPNHVQSGFPTGCQQCHNTTSWTNAVFDHSSTGFTLTGAHTSLQCNQCHTNGNFSLTGANTACVSCHLKDFQGTTTPNHVQSGFSQNCQQCHNTTSWNGVNFDHSTTGFTLTGAHVALQCAQCHTTTFNPSGAYSFTSGACVQCHLNDFKGATNPNHVQSGFPQTCEQCHNTTNWTSGSFDHSTTGFTLTGAHTTLQCAQCHTTSLFPGGAYTIPNGTCIQCHQTDYNGTTNPNHKQSGFPTACEQCHSTTNWLGATFNHASTGFTLTGFHTTLQCAQCHTAAFQGGPYSFPTPTPCVTCHQTDYNGTTSPNHAQAQLPTACEQCHTTTNWGGATFNHSSTGFTLDGAHVALQCTQCHTATFQGGPYSFPTPTPCVTCHMADFNGTNNPSHVQANFPTTCQTCHTTTNWLGATFNHASTGFTLTGFHTSLQCSQCHTAAFQGGPYSFPTPTPCVTCHQADFNGTNNPSHVQSGFPTTCDQCHTTTNWLGATFNHASTGFTLTGFHATMTCTQCHNTTLFPGGAYTIPNASCIQCHQADYNGTNAPPHATVGFPTTCDACHNFTNWLGATFNHNNTTFPLQGYHATSVTCAQCHVNNNYTGLSTDCYGCHKADYQGTTNPNHTAAGFPTTCLTCHTTWVTTNWLGATFNHTWFNTNHGNANGVCATCHTNPSDYTVFQCTGCHGNNNANNFGHPNVSGYVYNSVNCYQCHGKG